MHVCVCFCLCTCVQYVCVCVCVVCIILILQVFLFCAETLQKLTLLSLLSTLPLHDFHSFTPSSHPEGMDGRIHAVTHTLRSQSIKSRGFRSPLLPVFSELKSKGNFPFSFLPSQNFLFSFLPSSAVSFQRVCCSRPLFDPPPLSSPPPPLPGPLASSLERFPESAQINECKLVCMHVCEREGGRKNASVYHKL